MGLENPWVFGGPLHTLPAGRGQKDKSIELARAGGFWTVHRADSPGSDGNCGGYNIDAAAAIGYNTWQSNQRMVVSMDGIELLISPLAHFSEGEKNLSLAHDHFTAALDMYEDPDEVLAGKDKAERLSVMAKIKGYYDWGNKLKAIVLRHERKWAKLSPAQHGGDRKSGDYQETSMSLDNQPTSRQKKSYRELESISDPIFEQALTEVINESDVTRAAVIRKAEAIANPAPQRKPIHASATGDQEWYTPQAYIDAARQAMGSIELDPASCAAAQDVVKAEVYYDADDDGLAQDWRADTLFINPPFASKLINAFAEKLIDALDRGLVKQAVWLANNSSETAWWRMLAARANCVYFPAERLPFWKSDAKSTPGPVGQTLFYFGKRGDDFVSAYRVLGGTFYGKPIECAAKDKGCNGLRA